MTAVGQKRTFGNVRHESASPLKADIDRRAGHVRFVPKGDICTAAKPSLFDHLLGGCEHARRDGEAQRFLQGTSGTNRPYGIRSWKYFSTGVSPAGTLIASASPSAVLNSTM
jgi:hypothetical protein